MLKKLVKIGNSHALILDRAILELLEIEEGSVVKLRTDGKSLIITPEEPSLDTKTLSETGFEIIARHGNERLAAIEADPEKKKEFLKWQPGGEHFKKILKAIEPITKKYAEDLEKLTDVEFIREQDALIIKYKDRMDSQEYLEEYLLLRKQYAPRLDQMDQEIKEIRKKLGAPDTYTTM